MFEKLLEKKPVDLIAHLPILYRTVPEQHLAIGSLPESYQNTTIESHLVYIPVSAADGEHHPGLRGTVTLKENIDPVVTRRTRVERQLITLMVRNKSGKLA